MKHRPTRQMQTTPLRRRSNGQKVNPTVSALGSRRTGSRVGSRSAATRTSSSRLEDSRLPHQAARECRGESHRDRAQLGPHPRRYPHRASGHRHRSSWAEAERLKKDLEKITGQKNKISLNIQEIKQPELDAALIAQGICDQLLRRVAFRRAMKRGIQTVQKAAPWRQDPGLGPSRWRGDVAPRVLPRGSSAAAHAARRHRLRIPRGPHLDRAHRRKGGSTRATSCRTS